jgi:ribitol-5-phosphate 2-dehydrogenase
MARIERHSSAQEISPVTAVAYRIIAPWEIEPEERHIKSIPEGMLLLRPLWIGICAADLRYVAGRRPTEVLRQKLPLVPGHEGVAEVVGIGPGVEDVSPGDRVAIVPNIPCYVQDPETYPSLDEACDACRPGGAGTNYCTDVAFLGSTVDGVAQTHLLHPAWGVIKLPDDMPLDVAVLAEPVSVAIRAAKQVDIPAELCTCVLGAGVVGFLMTLTLSKAFDVKKDRLMVTDVRAPRLDAVKSFAMTTLSSQANGHCNFESTYGLIFECAGGQAAHRTIPQAINMLAPGGVCMLLGVTEGLVPIPTRLILDKGLCMKGSTRSTKKDVEEAVELLRDPDFRTAAAKVLYPATFPADSAESITRAARIADDPASYGRVLLRW